MFEPRIHVAEIRHAARLGGDDDPHETDLGMGQFEVVFDFADVSPQHERDLLFLQDPSPRGVVGLEADRTVAAAAHVGVDF